MEKVNELTSSILWNTLINQQTWGGVAVNVKAFGAKGDGVKDDTKAIQDAIDYAISIGKHEVTFAAGTYKYGVLTDTDGITFIGDGVTLNGTTTISLVNMSQLAGITYNPKFFGCKLDGTTDDSVLLQAFFDNPIVQGIVTFPPNSQILINTPITINKDNLEIDFNHCQIKWGNANNLGVNAQNRTLGVFNLKNDSEVIVGTPTNCVPKIVNGGNPGTEHKGSYYAKVTMPSAPTGVSAGDWLRVAMTVTGTQAASTLTPYFNVVVKCIKVSGNDIYFDYFNPFSFSGASYSFARVYKITPRHNVKIKNANFYDINTWDYKLDDDATIPLDTLQRTVSFIYASGCVDCDFENIYGNNTTNPIISLQMSSYCSVKNLEVDRPAITSPGRGYGVQVGASTRINIENVRGNYARHCVDFDNCSFSTTKFVNGRYMFATSFLTHGEYDHDLLFEDSDGSVGFNAGISFGSCTKNITFRRCYINEFQIGYSPNLKFFDCEVTVLPTIENASFPDYWSRAEFHHSKVLMIGGNWKAIIRTGDDDSRTYLKFFDCDVEILNYYSSGATLYPSFLNFEDIIFDNCDIKTQYNIDNSTSNSITINGLKNLTITGGKLRSTYFVIFGNATDTYLDFDGVEFAGYNVPNGITYNVVDLGYNSSKQLVKYNRVKTVYSGAGTLRAFRCGGTVNNNKNQKFVCTNGYFKSMTSNLLSFLVPLSSSVPANNTFLSGNVMVNTKQEGFATTDFTNNMWLTE